VNPNPIFRAGLLGKVFKKLCHVFNFRHLANRKCKLYTSVVSDLDGDIVTFHYQAGTIFSSMDMY
jgi:hypothetical protein